MAAGPPGVAGPRAVVPMSGAQRPIRGTEQPPVCRHDLTLGTCAACTRPASQRRAVVATRTTTARYRSTCPDCQLVIVPGTLLVWIDDRWVCRECAEVLA
jgi:hypothetical protein